MSQLSRRGALRTGLLALGAVALMGRSAAAEGEETPKFLMFDAQG